MPDSVELDTATQLRAAAASGLMALTGAADGPPLCPPGLVAGLDRLAASIALGAAATGAAVEVDWAETVSARAFLLGLRRRGRISANGTCRLIEGPGGWMALNLARPDDVAAVDAIVGHSVGPDPWEALRRALAESSVTEMVARARLLGVAAAVLGEAGRAARPPFRARTCWPPVEPRPVAGLHVVDLSSMWAGPLCAMLLARAGCHVVKVESSSRPDSARALPALYRSLHPDGQPVVTLDLATHEGRRRLRRLVEEADVVIESSRPRALEQLGCGPEDVDARAGRVWVSITGHGRDEPGRNWVAFGDDAAVAGGLVAWTGDGQPVFCGDALADPIAGMTAAGAAMEAVAGGGGALLDVSMQHCAASLAPPGPVPSTPAGLLDGAWWVRVDGELVPVRDRAAEAQLAS